jgi:formylglycine-generating enzyme required for sulfatase activity
MAWTPIGNPANSCDPQPGGCYGAVAYSYEIGTYEVTNAQFAEFLNAKAAPTDPLFLYDVRMGNNPSWSSGGIRRDGTPGSYTYAPIGGRENLPVNHVSWFDAARFANWMNNGQGNADTETGSYTLLGGTPVPSNASTIVRNPGAAIVVPNEDEWYKPAYYDAASQAYLDYPVTAGSVVCSPPTATPGRANCANAVADLTDAGSYSGSASPNGTFDQGGNVSEWLEVNLCSGCSNPSSFWGQRGGSFDLWDATLAASYRSGSDGNTEVAGLGFRVARLPEPDTGLPVVVGLLGITARIRRACAG